MPKNLSPIVRAPNAALLVLSATCLAAGCRNELVDALPEGAVWGESCEVDASPAEAIGLDDACETPVQRSGFEPVVEWAVETFSSAPGAAEVMATPVVGPLLGGGAPEVVVISYGDGAVLRVLDGADGTEHWSRSGDALQPQGTPALGDLDGDGVAEIVAPTEDGEVLAFTAEGDLIWRSDAFEAATWYASAAPDMDALASAPAIADLDGDGAPEVIVGRVILDGATGATRGVGARGIGRPSNLGAGTTSFAADLDLDGRQEVVVGDALYGPDGETLASNNDGDGYVAAGNFDDDEFGEIVVVRDGLVTVYNHDMTPLWGPVDFGSEQGGPPTVSDFDGDGAPEIGVAGLSVYAVLDTDGALLWSRETQDASSGVTGSAVYDFEGDGLAEVVYADETTLWAFHGPDGEVKFEAPHASDTWVEYPTVADVDGDGHAEILIGHNPYWAGEERYGLTLYSDLEDSWSASRQVWNQHAYHITNVSDDLSIPAQPEINWLRYNNFRSGNLLAGQGREAPDLSVELLGVCEDLCAEGEVFLQVRARNEGAAEASAVTLALYVDEVELDAVTLPEPVAAGEASTSVGLSASAEALAGGFTLRADPADAIHECDENDNDESWFLELCASE